MSSWVEERAKRELDLEAHAREFWEAFALACETAVVQYERYYQMRPTAARIERVNEDSLAVHLTFGGNDRYSSQSITLTARYHDGLKTIYFGETHRACIERDATGQLVAVMEGKSLSPDQLCKRWLEPQFFPKDKRMAKVQDPEGGAE